MRSSYIQNDFGKLLEEYVVGWQPSSLVELGVLDGYSTTHIARGVQRLQKLRNFKPVFDSYDLFDDYEFKHGKQEEVQKAIDDAGLTEFVNLKKGNAYEVHKNYPDSIMDEVKGVEYLHVDISNTGKVVKDIMEIWHPKIGRKGLVFFEGGSDERDNIEWMKKYNMPSIKEEIRTNPIINEHYIYGTYFKYPSLTVLLKKWWY